MINIFGITNEDIRITTDRKEVIICKDKFGDNLKRFLAQEYGFIFEQKDGYQVARLRGKKVDKLLSRK